MNQEDRDRMYVSGKPKPVSENKDYSVFRNGLVTEITLGDQTFNVVAAEKIDEINKLVNTHENSMFEMRQHMKKQATAISQLFSEIQALKAEIQKLKDGGNDGFGREINL